VNAIMEVFMDGAKAAWR